MKAQILQENFSKVLAVASRFTASRVQLPILANVLFRAKGNKLTILATNLEVSVASSVGAKVEKEGEITVPARAIFDIVNNLKPGQIALEAEKEILKISSLRFSSQISGVNANDFPSIPESLARERISLEVDKLTSALGKTLFAISSDASRPILTGALFIFEKKGLTIVSSDGFRLSKVDIKTDGGLKEQNLVLPKSILMELTKLSQNEKSIEVNFREKDNQMVFGIGDMVVSSRILQGTFPDFSKIIPKGYELKVGCDKEELLQAVKLASIFARDSANVVKIKVGSDVLELKAESSNVGSQEGKVEAKIESKSEKPNLEIAFNCKFLEDWLNSIEGETVEIEFTDSGSPGVFRDTLDKDYLHLIMPVKI